MPYAVCIVSLAWLSLVGAGAMVLLAAFGGLSGEPRTAFSFLGSAVVAAFIGGATLFALRGMPLRSARRELILTPVICWIAVPAILSVPLLLALPDFTLTQAYFETVSALTTTGATIIVSLDEAPSTLLLWRAVLQWLGGFATIAMVIPLFPLLNIGGMSVFNNVLPHGEGDSIGERVRGAVRALWTVYCLLTLACIFSLWLVGVPLFDGLCLGLSTLSTGGFMVRDGGLEIYDNPLMEVILVPFMLIGAINFSLHWAFLYNRRALYRRDPEVKRLLRIALIAGVLMTVLLGTGLGIGTALPGWESVRIGMFTAVSMLTTTGFTTGEEGTFPLSPALLILPLIVLGGCTGSTAGGIKMMRLKVLGKHGEREFFRLSHPHGVIRTSYAGRVMSDEAMAAAWAFFIVFVLTLCAITLMLAAIGLDLHAAVAAATSALTNTGTALTLLDGQLAGYSMIESSGLWLLSLAMIMGRLEVLPVLILLSPMFWRG